MRLRLDESGAERADSVPRGSTRMRGTLGMEIKTHELRVALTVDDFDSAVEFYSSVLGLELAAQWDQPRGKGGVFVVPTATLEILDREMAVGVDEFEVGKRVSGQVRLALGVADTDASVGVAESAGAVTLGATKVAPWGDSVARVETPDGMQLTLFSASAQ